MGGSDIRKWLRRRGKQRVRQERERHKDRSRKIEAERYEKDKCGESMKPVTVKDDQMKKF